MTARRLVLAALVAVVALPGAASAASGPVSVGPSDGARAGVSGSGDERWVCLGDPGERPYCVTVWFPVELPV